MISNKLTISSNCRFAIYCLLSLFLGMNPLTAQTYCASKGNLPWQEWIAGVKFGTINNASAKEGYGNFTSQTTNLAQGTSYPLSITQGFSYAPDAANATQQGKVWIDYNQNKVFEATELVASFTRTTTTANVAIPTTALLGATRMRVSLKTIGVPTACEVFDKGEVEDYTVNIEGGVDPCLTDVVPPVFQNCPKSDTAFNNIVCGASGPCGGFFTWTPPTVTDNCTTNPVVTANYQPGEPYVAPNGKITINYTATDAKGNIGRCSFTRTNINVSSCQSIAPLAFTNCPVNINLTTTVDSAVATWTAPTLVYVCGQGSTFSNFLSGQKFPVGTTQIIVRGLDSYRPSQSATCAFQVTVTRSTVGRDTLRITNVTGATTAEPNGTLPLSITIKNSGTVASKADSIGLLKWRYYDATYAVPFSLNKIAIPAIAAGQSITVTGNFQMPSTLVDIGVNVGDLYVGIDAAVKTYRYSGCSYYGSSDNCLGYRYPIKPATTTDLALTGTVVQDLYSRDNLQVSFKVKLKNLGAKSAKNISVALNNYFSTGNGQYFGLKNVALTSGSGTYEFITVYRSVDQSNQYSTWQIPNLNARDSVEATFTADIAFNPGAPLPTTSGSMSSILYADIQDSNTANDKTGLSFNLANANTCRYQDSLSLVRLNVATGGANWTTKWNLATPINTWYGVTLNANGCVSGLLVMGNNLTGTLPNVSLSSLKFINLSSNKITGAIPNFNNVPILEELVLNNNLLTGAIPNLSLPNLKFLILYTNQLSGSIPNLNLQNLVTFDAHENKLTGAVPNFNLQKIVNLILDNNLLVSLPNFSTMPLLETIDVNTNQLTGSIPSFSLPALKSFIAANNKFTGSVPTFSSPNLSAIILSNNQLSGCLPLSLRAFCGKNVNLTNNPSLSNQDFATFCSNNTGACVVVNNSCRTQDSLQLVSLYSATSGDFWVNKWELDKPIDTWYGVGVNANGCVTEIRMDNNYLNGTMPNLNLPNLQSLELSNNPITGTIPNFNLPNLKRLDFFNCKLLGTIPNFNLPKLEFLLLNLNKFTGTIPNFNYPNLQTISLSGNLLTGSIPNFNLPKLQILFVSDNKLSGTIPNLNAPLLSSFLIANNQLSGCLPAFLKNMCNIYTIVDISGNPSLSNQNFATFCSNNTGACGTGGGTASVTLSIGATPSVYQQYQTTTFKITAKNTGTTATAGTKIEFKFPVKTVSGGATTASIGAFQEWCSGGVQCFTWTIPSLAAGATATLDVPLFVLDATAPIVATTKVLDVPTTSTNVATITVNRAGTPQAPASQALAFKVPTQLIPVVIQAISPNPTEGDVQIKLDSWTKQTVDFNFSDITGKVIHSEKRDLEKGVNRLDFEVFHLPQGVYFIQTNVGKGKDVPTKFVKM